MRLLVVVVIVPFFLSCDDGDIDCESQFTDRNFSFADPDARDCQVTFVGCEDGVEYGVDCRFGRDEDNDENAICDCTQDSVVVSSFKGTADVCEQDARTFNLGCGRNLAAASTVDAP